ncbi:MAG: hypothetical protein ACO2ZP_09180 [Bacteriovoracaceae bacterium]
MSTKSTIKLTSNNEHIYYDLDNNTLTIELDEFSIKEVDGDIYNFYVDIDLSSEVGTYLMKKLVSDKWNGKDFIN